MSKKSKKKKTFWSQFWNETKRDIRGNLNDHQPWEKWVDVGAVTLLTLFFTWLAIHSSFTGDLFSTVADTEGPELIDLYTTSSRRTGLPKYSAIAVMSVDGCSRQDIAIALERLREMHPTSIGLDMTFPYYSEEDEGLMNAILNTPNIVMATSATTFSYFENRLRKAGVTFGSVDFDIDARHDVVRSFTPGAFTQTDTIWAFETQLARKAGAGTNVAKFYPYDKHAFILYPNLVIDTISCKSLVADDANLKAIAPFIRDKIVIMGYVANTTQLYRTPIDADMPGVMIHAYALDTMLRGHTIAVSSVWLNWFVAFVVCVAFAFLMLFYKWGLSDADGLTLRMTQIMLMLLIVVIPGVWFFYQFHWYFDFTPTFFALAIQAIVLDIWVGLMAVCLRMRKSIRSNKAKSTL